MTKKLINRRQFLQLSTVSTAGTLLVACTPKATPTVSTQSNQAAAEPTKAEAPAVSAPQAEAVTITFMGWGGTEEDEGVRKAITQFESEQSEVKVTWLHTPDSYAEKLLASVAAGTPPDTAFIASDMYRTYARDEMLLDITKYVTADTLVGAPNYFMEPQEKDRCTYKDKWYGIGSCWVAPHMYYNADTLNAAGVELPSSDPEKAWDWDTFLEICQKLTKDVNGKNPTEDGFDPENIERFAISWPTWWIPMRAAILSNGGDYCDPATGLFSLDKPEAVEAIQAIYDLNLKYHVMPSDEYTQQLGMSVVQMLENGKLAMAIDGSWALSWMYKMKGTLGTAVCPKMKVPATDMQAHLHSALQGSKNPDAAWKWVKFLSTPFYQTQFCKMGLWLPSQTALLSKEGLSTWITPEIHPQGYDQIVSDYVAKYGKVLYMGPGYPKTNDIMTPVWDQIRLGTAQAKDVLPAAIEEANKILQEEANK